MNINKIVRSISYFTLDPSAKTVDRLNEIKKRLADKDFEVQTIRICSRDLGFKEIEEKIGDPNVTIGLGNVEFEKAKSNLQEFYETRNVFFNFLFKEEKIEEKHVEILFELIKNKPGKTFNFTFDFNTPPSSAFYPTARYEKEGFSVGLQPTDLAENCLTLDEWFSNMKSAWLEVAEVFGDDKDFLGIDSSVAPLFQGKSSLVNFIKRIHEDFNGSTTTDTYVKITEFIKKENPKPIGLCGLMFPCLEDFELAGEYEKGNFDVERNLFLSLNSGLGIDTYPVGTDESPERLLQVLKLEQALSNKYKKALSARFVSDGKAKTGEKTDFKNQYLKDVIIRKL